MMRIRPIKSSVKCGRVTRTAYGFTLIEMIVAVAIFGVIASIIFPALIQFLDVRERIEEKHKQVLGLQKAFLFLAQDLRYASNRLGKDEFGEPNKATISVNDDSLIDLTANYPDLELAGLNVPRRVRWILEDGIIQRIQSPVMDPDGDTRTIRQILLENVEEVDVELSVIEEGRGTTSKRWDEQTRLPDMISITVTMDNGIEYLRRFTMLSGDTLAAVAQANNESLNGNADAPNDGEGAINDVDNDAFSEGLGNSPSPSESSPGTNTTNSTPAAAPTP